MEVESRTPAEVLEEAKSKLSGKDFKSGIELEVCPACGGKVRYWDRECPQCGKNLVAEED
jgi:predicted amidophosphoribosyltransferase